MREGHLAPVSIHLITSDSSVAEAHHSLIYIMVMESLTGLLLPVASDRCTAVEYSYFFLPRDSK